MSDENHQDEQNQNTEEITIEKLEKDLQEAMNGWKRTAADFENYKRRKEGESKELLEFAKEVTVVKLLPTIDTLEQALRHLPEYHPHPTSPLKGEENKVPLPGGEGQGEGDEFAKKYQNWQTGVNGIIAQLDKVLGELGVRKIEAVGKKFDPHYHEAVKEVEGEEDQVVVDELQTGFELNGKVIRPSQVVISKKM